MIAWQFYLHADLFNAIMDERRELVYAGPWRFKLNYSVLMWDTDWADVNDN